MLRAGKVAVLLVAVVVCGSVHLGPEDWWIGCWQVDLGALDFEVRERVRRNPVLAPPLTWEFSPDGLLRVHTNRWGTRPMRWSKTNDGVGFRWVDEVHHFFWAEHTYELQRSHRGVVSIRVSSGDWSLLLAVRHVEPPSSPPFVGTFAEHPTGRRLVIRLNGEAALGPNSTKQSFQHRQGYWEFTRRDSDLTVELEDYPRLEFKITDRGLKETNFHEARARLWRRIPDEDADR